MLYVRFRECMQSKGGRTEEGYLLFQASVLKGNLENSCQKGSNWSMFFGPKMDIS